MSKKLMTPYAAPKRGLPCELKYDYARGGYAGLFKGFMYAIREKYGANAAIKIHERFCIMDDRVKKSTNSIQTIFNITDNNCETIGEVVDIWDEFTGIESTILERSKTINRRKVTKCPWKTDPIDIGNWALSFYDITGKIINLDAALERSKAMCSGDPYCEYVWKLEESTPFTAEEIITTKKLETPCSAPKKGLSCDIKLDFILGSYADLLKGFMYAIREIYGANSALKVYERVCTMDDRVKRFINTLLKIFNLEGNDAETIGAWWDIYQELTGIEAIIFEQSKTIDWRRMIKCPFKTAPKDISDRCIFFCNLITKTINSNATYERSMALCAGDPYCEFITRIEE